MLMGSTLIPWSSAVATGAFAVLGPMATSGWRFVFGAVVLLVFTRPKVRSWSRRQWLGALALGASITFMNVCFYQAISRIPLGGAVAIEYLGPFLVAALGKRSARHLALVALAGLGVLAITRPGGGLMIAGVLFAAGAGLGWACYAFSSQRVGSLSPGFGGLAVSMSIAAVLTLPMSLGTTSTLVHHPYLVGRIALVAVMSIVLGVGAEMQALRRLKPSIVGVLFSMNPAIAFAVGWLLLNQAIRSWDYVGVACVVVAGVGVTYDAAKSDLEVAQ
jgi:inner membrane transporter RhtA